MIKVVSVITLIISIFIFNIEDDATTHQNMTIISSDSLALVALYNATNGNQWNRSWDLQLPVSSWQGIGLRVDTNGTRVSEINLENNNLNGTIPAQIGDLIALRILRLQRNKLKGTIPDEIIQLKELTELFLYNNIISGRLPDSIGQLSNLRMLSLASNQMTGSLPSSIGMLSELRQLVLDQNNFNGTLPLSITSLNKLTFLDLHNNAFEGSLPDSLHLLSAIQELLIYNNNLTGYFPSSISKLNNLTHLWANNNNLSGIVPDFSLVPMRSLRIAQNDFTDLGNLNLINSIDTNNSKAITFDLNQLSFDDIIFHLNLIDSLNINYLPQKEIQLEDTILVRSGDPWIYQLPFDDTISSSSYKWFKNDQIVELGSDNRFIIPSVSKADEGLYRCRISNRVITDMDLNTSSIRLIIKESSDCGNPPPVDECFLTDPLCGLDELDNYCADMDSLSNHENLSFCGQNFTLLDRDWFSFIAGEENIRIRITPYNCSSNKKGGLVAWVFDNCNLGTPLNCDTVCQRSTFEIAVNQLTIGQTYYLLIGGCSGICSYEISVRNGGSSLDLNNPGSIIGENDICDLDKNYTYSLENSIPGASDFQWEISHPDTNFSVIDSIFETRWVHSGQYEICVRAYNNCDTTLFTCRSIDIYPNINIENHDTEIFSDDGVYSVKFKITGGQSPYTIIGASGTYNALDRIFTSDTIACGISYLITIKDVNGCEVDISGVEHCNCISFAGTMSDEVIESCEYSAFKAEHLGGEILDTNDIAYYILHEGGNGNQLGNIIDINTTGIFRFNNQLMFLDTFYQITYAVGNRLNNNDLQFNDPCLSLSNSQSVVFHEVPNANAGTDQLICFGPFFLEAIKSNPNSNGNWQYVSGPFRPSIDKPNSTRTEVHVIFPGTYIFRWLEVHNNCIGSDSVVIEVKPMLSVEISGLGALCDGLSTELSVPDSFSHYIWSNGESGSDITIKEPGTYSVTVTDDIGCTATNSKTIEEEISPQIIIEGENKECTDQLFNLSAHKEFAKYEWSTGDTTKNIMTDLEGIICVTITDEKGCQGDDCIITKYKEHSTKLLNDTLCFGDSLVIDQNVIKTSGIYEIVLSGANQVACDSTIILNLVVHPEIFISDTLIIHDHGSNNGAISVSIEGGKRPYEYLWNNGKTSPFLSQLESGIYTLNVTDGNNCTQEFNFRVKSTVSSKLIDKKPWKLSIQPNIVSGNEDIRIVGSSNIPMNVELIIYSAHKQLISKHPLKLLENERVLMIRENLNAGLYFVAVRHNNQTIEILKMMVLD